MRSDLRLRDTPHSHWLRRFGTDQQLLNGHADGLAAGRSESKAVGNQALTPELRVGDLRRYSFPTSFD